METLKAIAKRKSTRAFSPEKKVSKADLDKILAAGCAAPVGMANYESLHLTVVENTEMLEKIEKTAKEAFKIDRNILYGAPVLVLVCASVEQKAPNIEYANAACIIENMLLAASDAGIESVYLWGAANVVASNPALQKDLGIPDGFRPVSGLILGYAAEENSTEKELGIKLSVNYI